MSGAKPDLQLPKAGKGDFGAKRPDFWAKLPDFGPKMAFLNEIGIK
jgi:hypothetical protein